MSTSTLDRRIQDLQSENRRLDNERRRLAGLPSREEEQDSKLDRFVEKQVEKQFERQTSPSDRMRQEIERQRGVADGLCKALGIPADAPDEFKSFALVIAQSFEQFTRTKLLELAVAMAGEQSSEDLTYQRLAGCWQKMDARQQAALQDTVAAIQHQVMMST